MASPVQSVAYNSTADSTTHPITFAAPTVGNRIIIGVNAGSGVTGVSGSGWTREDGIISNTDTAIYSKIAGASEPTTVTFTIGGAASCNLYMEEYANAVSGVADKTAHNDSGVTPGGSQTTIPTGTTAATTVADAIAFAVFGVVAAAGAVGTYTNGFAEASQGITSGGGGTNVRMAVATKTLTATGTVSSQASSTNAQGSMLGVVAVFGLTSGGGGGGSGPETLFIPRRRVRRVA